MTEEIHNTRPVSFWGYRQNGTVYWEKIVGDVYCAVTCGSAIAAVLVPHGSVDHLLGMLGPLRMPTSWYLWWGPFVCPLLFLMMESDWTRTVRFSAAAVFAAWWFWVLLPAI